MRLILGGLYDNVATLAALLALFHPSSETNTGEREGEQKPAGKLPIEVRRLSTLICMPAMSSHCSWLLIHPCGSQSVEVIGAVFPPKPPYCDRPLP